MGDPRNAIEKFIDTLDELIISFNDLKKMLLPFLDLLPRSEKGGQDHE